MPGRTAGLSGRPHDAGRPLWARKAGMTSVDEQVVHHIDIQLCSLSEMARLLAEGEGRFAGAGDELRGPFRFALDKVESMRKRLAGTGVAVSGFSLTLGTEATITVNFTFPDAEQQ